VPAVRGDGDLQAAVGTASCPAAETTTGPSISQSIKKSIKSRAAD